jgi:hypothetical protein
MIDPETAARMGTGAYPYDTDPEREQRQRSVIGWRDWVAAILAVLACSLIAVYLSLSIGE